MKPTPIFLGISICILLFVAILFQSIYLDTQFGNPYNPNGIISTIFLPVKSPITNLFFNPGIYFTGAGDISICGQDGDEQTALLLQDVPGYIFTVGDNQNDESKLDYYYGCFDKSWGKYKNRIIPVVGNHEYRTPDAGGYFGYFGEHAGQNNKGYFSLDIGSWHIVTLNSNCSHIGGCDENSEMIKWLEADLSQNKHKCTLAMWHEPYFSPYDGAKSEKLESIWHVASQHGVDLVLNGHLHVYDRQSPLDINGNIDFENGTRQIVIGTGGANLQDFESTNPNSESFCNDTYGVLQLHLENGAYTWEFIPVEGGTFTDSGKGYCH